MPDLESRRLALYNGLNDLLGADLADTLMTYLPASPGTSLATSSDISGLRSDMGALKTELRSDMGELKSELTDEMADLKTELRDEMADLKTELRGEMADLKTVLRGEMADLKTVLRDEMADLKTELRDEMADLKTELRGEMADLKTDIGANTDEIRHLSHRMDRLQSTLLTGFVAMIAALLAAGFLG